MLIKVYTINITAINHEQYVKCLQLIPLANRQRIKKIRDPQDAQRTLLGEILSRYLLIIHCHCSNKNLKFIRNQQGKPIIDNVPDIHFNISHSGEWVVGTIYNKIIGIDIEYIRDINFALAKRFFTKQENAYLSKHKEKSKLQCFFELWTAKESYVKAIGLGISLPLNTINIHPKKNLPMYYVEQGSIHEHSNCTHTVTNTFYIKHYSLNQHYKIAVCAQSRTFAKKVTMLNLQNILDTLNPIN